MSDCSHARLKKLADTMFQQFSSFKQGFKFYRCSECGMILKAAELKIDVVKPDKKETP